MIEISDSFPRTNPLGDPYPRVYRAESIEDMQTSRAAMARGIDTKASPIPKTEFTDQPYQAPSLSSIVILRSIRHSSETDLVRGNLGMILTDPSDPEGIRVWYHENSLLDFPSQQATFGKDLSNMIALNKSTWEAYQNFSWVRRVVIMAQYTQLSNDEINQLKAEGRQINENHLPVSELYWLLHVSNYQRTIKEKSKEKVERSLMDFVPGLVPGMA